MAEPILNNAQRANHGIMSATSPIKPAPVDAHASSAGTGLAQQPFTLSRSTWLPVAVALLVLFVPTVVELARTTWASDAQGHGPIVFALSLWLFHRNWPRTPITDVPRPIAGWILMILGASAYAVGRSQGLTVIEAGSSVMFLVGLALILSGTALLRALWFPLVFICFTMPLPPQLVDTVTQPMKLAVSYVAEAVLAAADLPVARSGVILQVGPYQLLVADACAGLQTLFTLEAMGLLYMNVFRHSSLLRNAVLAILIVPISFIANVIRVIALILITYFFGDEAGQGFLHGFAGMVLFMSSFMLIISADTALRAMVDRKARRAAGVSGS